MESEAVIRTAHAASRLLTLEAEERRLCARMQRDRVRRTIIGEAITRLRCGMSEFEAERYRKIKFRQERLMTYDPTDT